MACTSVAILDIVTLEAQADGSQRTKRISLLDGKNGIWLNDWSPSHLNYKGGGQQVNPPMSDGITPIFAAWDDVIDTFTISAKGRKQNQTIKRLRALGDLLVKAVQYWVTDWQDEVVWIEAKGAHETQTRYAEIKLWQIPGHSNPYYNPFYNVSESALGDIPVTITHAPWSSVPPGQPCPENRTETISLADSGCDPSYLEFDGGTDLVNCGSAANLDDIPDNAVAGRGKITAEAYIRSRSTGGGNLGRIFEKASWRLMVAANGLQGEVACAAQTAISNSGTDELDPTDGLWHHVAMVYDETGADTPVARTIYLAIDGVWVASYPTQQVSIGNYVTDAVQNLYLGNIGAGTRGFDGDIAWSRVSDSIRYDPAGGNFTPDTRCAPPDPSTGTQLLFSHTPGYGAQTDDLSGHSNDGAITGAEWACDCFYNTTEYPCWPNCLRLNGETSIVNCGSAAVLDDLPDFAVAGKGKITAEAWILSNSPGGGITGRILEKTRWVLMCQGNNGLQAEIVCAGQNAISNSGLDEFDPTDGLWHHVAMVYDETGADTPVARTIYLAIDGVWVASYPTQQVSIGNYVTDAANNLNVGNIPGLNRCFDGLIGWVRVSDNVRYDPAGGDFTPEPRCQLPAIDANVVLQVIYEGTGATTYDRSGNDNNGAITEAVWGCDCDYLDTDDVECNCVQAEGDQGRWEYEVWAAISSVQPVAAVRSMIELTHTPFRMLAGETNEVWRNDDGGAVWTASTVPPAGNVVSIVEDPTDGDIFCATSTPAIYRSQDGGINWALRTNVLSCVHEQQFIRASDGYFYIRSSVDAYLYRSNDDCATWVLVFIPPPAIGIQALFETSTGRLLCFTWSAGEVGRVYFSDDGTTWNFTQEYTTRGAGISAAGLSIIERDSVIYLGTFNGQVFASYDNGEHWAYLSTIAAGSQIYDFILHTDGYFYASANGVIYKSFNMISWKTMINIAAAAKLLSYSRNERIYIGENGNIWTSSDFLSLGRLSCLDEVFIANKSTLAQITDVFVYDAGTGTYIDQYPAPAIPFFLLPSPAVAGDALYIGLQPGVLDSGPFCSLIFDLLRVYGTAAGTQLWEYSQGGGAWATLNVSDGTEMGGVRFSRAGVNGVFWVPPSDWATDSPPGLAPAVTALWVRLRITVGTLVNWQQSPIQQRRDIYTVNWPDVNIDNAQVGGDISALLRIKAHNRSDEDAYTTKDELDLMTNRAIISLRETLRGDQFTCFINLAEDGVVANTYSQNSIGITVTDGTGTTTAAAPRAPSGIACVHSTTGNGLENYDDAATITFGPSIARDFYGTFHAYLRAHLYYPSGGAAGDVDDVRVRLKIQTGAGGIIEYTEYKTFTGYDAWGATEEERYDDFYLLDFGRIKLPVAGTIRQSELPDQFTITIQIASAAATVMRVKLYDFAPMPADEFIGDFQDVAFEDDSAVDNGYFLDTDSIYFLKPPGIRSLVRTSDATEFIKANYEPNIAGQIFLQEDADQRLFFLAARAAKEGEHTGANNVATLTDARADFIEAGVYPGLTIYNITDGSSATITDVTATTVEGTLAGGAEDDWDTGDVYLIICPNWLAPPSIIHSIQLEKRQRYLDMRGET